LLAGGLTSAALSGLSPLVPGENDIDQLGKMTQILGSIENNWPGVQEMPDWGKVSFPNCPGRPLSDLLPGASEAALELLAGMIKWVIIDHVSMNQEDSVSMDGQTIRPTTGSLMNYDPLILPLPQIFS
jgi:hypothetical protein